MNNYKENKVYFKLDKRILIKCLKKQLQKADKLLKNLILLDEYC